MTCGRKDNSIGFHFCQLVGHTMPPLSSLISFWNYFTVVFLQKRGVNLNFGSSARGPPVRRGQKRGSSLITVTGHPSLPLYTDSHHQPPQVLRKNNLNPGSQPHSSHHHRRKKCPVGVHCPTILRCVTPNFEPICCCFLSHSLCFARSTAEVCAVVAVCQSQSDSSP